MDRQERKKRDAVRGTGEVAVIRTVTREDKAATQLFSIQTSAESVAVPDARLLFTAEFSRIDDDLLLTSENGTVSPDRGLLRARRATHAAVAARCDAAARVGRRICRLEARRAQPLPVRKNFARV